MKMSAQRLWSRDPTERHWYDRKLAKIPVVHDDSPACRRQLQAMVEESSDEESDMDAATIALQHSQWRSGRYNKGFR